MVKSDEVVCHTRALGAGVRVVLMQLFAIHVHWGQAFVSFVGREGDHGLVKLLQVCYYNTPTLRPCYTHVTPMLCPRYRAAVATMLLGTE